MSDDIVNRLLTTTDLPGCGVLREAADEIERLRAGLETIANGYATTKIVTAPDGDPSIVLIEHDEFARKILEGVNDDR